MLSGEDGGDNMPELSEEQKEMVELAQVILEEFPDASEMTD